MEVQPEKKLNRFRKVNATKAKLESIAHLITPPISRLTKMHQGGQIQDWAFVYAILIVHAHALLGQKIWGSRLTEKSSMENIPDLSTICLEDLFSVEIANPPYTQKIGPKTSLRELLMNWRLKLVPQKAQNTLQSWAVHNWRLQIFHRPLEWKEVLTMQANESRCVTVITDKEELSNHVLSERDPWSFTIHDLEHAFQFFSDPLMHKAQCGFYRKILHALNLGLFREVPLPELCKYSVSDMNSHPLHMWLTFRQGILESQNREPQAYSLCFRNLFKIWGISTENQGHFLEPKPCPTAADWITDFFTSAEKYDTPAPTHPAFSTQPF